MLLSPKCLVSLIVLLFAQNILLEEAFAGSRRSRKKNRRVTYETYEYAEPTSSGPLDSASLRVAKRFGLGVHVGAMNGMLLGMGPAAHYTIHKLYQIEGRLIMGFGHLKTSEGAPSREFVEVEKQGGEAMEFGVRLKIFPFNSFYIAPGLSYRQLAYTLRAKDKENKTLESEVDGHVFAMDFGIGNTWTFDNGFYLGCEWLSFSKPASNDYEITKKLSGESEHLASYHEDFLRYADNQYEERNYGLLMMHLGYSF